MADPLIRLTLGAIDITLRGDIFEVAPQPRTNDPDQAGSVSQSLAGSTIVNGSSFTPKQLWTIPLATGRQLGTVDRAEAIRELWAYYDSLRRAGSDPKITLEDTSAYWFDIGSRTRALATGASEIVTDTGVKYYAKYYAHFTEPPVFELELGTVIQLREGVLFSA